MNRVSPGSQPTVEIVVRRCVIPTPEAPRGGEHVVDVQERLAHAHEHAVVHLLEPPEMERLVEDLRGVRLRPNCIGPWRRTCR